MLERSHKYVFVIYVLDFAKFHLLQTDYTRAKYGYFAPFCSSWSALVSPFFFFPEQTGGFASLYASSIDLLVFAKVDDQGGSRTKLVDDQGRCRTKLVDDQEGCRTKLVLISSSCQNKQSKMILLFVW